MTAKLGSDDGTTRPVTATVPARLDPSAGVRNVATAASSGRVTFAEAKSLFVPVVASTSHQISCENNSRVKVKVTPAEVSSS